MINTFQIFVFTPIELLVEVPIELSLLSFEDEEPQDDILRQIMAEQEEDAKKEYTRMVFNRIDGIEETKDGCVIWRDELSFVTQTPYEEVKRMLGW